MNQILPQAEELLSTLKQLMPTMYQQETLESILGLLLEGQGNSVPHHCQTKSASAKASFFKSIQMVNSFSNSDCSFCHSQAHFCSSKKRQKTNSSSHA